jgi:long-chain acyl-CoA synthetase
VHKWIEEDMRKFEKDLGKFERVRHFIVKRKPFTLEAEEMTPTQKIKRKIVEKKYEESIKNMYVKIVE